LRSTDVSSANAGSILWRVLAVLWALALACAATADPVTLKLWAGGGFRVPRADATTLTERADRAVIDAFIKAHPEIKLELVNGVNIQGPAMESAILMALAGEVGPDVIYVNIRQLYSFIDQGFLYPLDEFIAREPQVMEKVYPNIRKVLRQNGHYYCVPYQQLVQALYYRKDMFREAGLDPNKPPRDWNEFYDYCKKLCVPSKSQYGFSFDTGPQSRGYWWVNFLWQAGGDVLEKTPSGQFKSIFNSSAGVAALKFYKHLVGDPWTDSEGHRHIGVAGLTSDFRTDIQKNKIAMWFGYQSSVIANTQSDVMNPSVVGIAPMPKGPTGITGNEINAAMFGINAQQKDPRVREAAWEFIKYMGSDEADRIRVKAYVDNGLGNLVNPAMLRKYGYDELITPVGEVWEKAMKSLFEHGKHEPFGKGVQMIYLGLDQPLEEYVLYPTRDPKKILDRAAADVDAKMLGYVPAGVMKERREAAAGVLAGLLLAAGATLLWLVRGKLRMPKLGVARMAGAGNARSRAITWLFMIPALASIALWMYVPLGRGLVMAFEDYKITEPPRWVGLDNFIEAAAQHTFWIGMLNSLEFVALSLGIGFFLPVILAIMLSEIPWGKTLFRTLYYLPAVTSGLVIIFMWRQFYAAGTDGLFNQLLSGGATTWNHFAHFAHLPWMLETRVAIDWLGDPKWAMIAVVLPGIWAAAGPGSIIYIAALRTVPESLYEAADLDGAGIWHKITRIALPSIKPLIVINLVGAFIGAFKSTESIFVLTGGGPLERTHVIGLEIWYNAFVYLKFGYATAAAWMMGILLIGFTLYQLRILRNVRFGAGQ
jgi:multiple sugar transport system permease protein